MKKAKAMMAKKMVTLEIRRTMATMTHDHDG
jgi:hypothetical protein